MNVLSLGLRVKFEVVLKARPTVSTIQIPQFYHFLYWGTTVGRTGGTTIVFLLLGHHHDDDDGVHRSSEKRRRSFEAK